MRFTLLFTFLSMLILQAGSKNISKPSTPPIPIIEEISGFYLGGAINHFALYNTDADESIKTYGATLIAGYQINNYLSMEGRYTRSKSITYHKNSKTKSLSSHYTNTAIYAKAGYPTGSFTPYVLLGYGQNTITNLIGSDRVENSIQYGAGVSIKATDNLSIFSDYIRAYQGKGFDGRATAEHQHINLITAGLTYKF